MGVQHALRPADRSRRIDQKGRVVGVGVGVIGRLGAGCEPLNLLLGQNPHGRRRRMRQRQVVRERDRYGFGVGEQELRLLAGQRGSRGQRHEAGRKRGEECQDVGHVVVHADHQPRALRQTEPAQPAREPAHRQVKGAIAHLVWRARADHDQRRLVRMRRGLGGDAVAGDVEPWRWRKEWLSVHVRFPRLVHWHKQSLHPVCAESARDSTCCAAITLLGRDSPDWGAALGTGLLLSPNSWRTSMPRGISVPRRKRPEGTAAD